MTVQNSLNFLLNDCSDYLSVFGKQILVITRGQRQIMHQLDNLSNLLHEYWGERSRHGRRDETNRFIGVDSMGIPLILTLAIAGLGVFLFKGFTSHK